MVYFPDDFATMNGLSLAGGTVAVMVIPLVMEYLNSSYGWRSALALMGAFSLNYVICGALLRPLRKPIVKSDSYVPVPTSDDSRVSEEKKKVSMYATGHSLDTLLASLRSFWQLVTGYLDTQFLANGKFVLYQLVFIFCMLLFTVWNLFLIPHCANLGYDDALSAVLATFGGFGGLIGRLSHGLLVDRGLVSAHSLFIACSMIFALSSFLDPLAVSSYAALAALATVSGLMLGVMYPLTFVLLRDVTGDKHMAAYGWLFCSHGVGSVLGGFGGGEYLQHFPHMFGLHLAFIVNNTNHVCVRVWPGDKCPSNGCPSNPIDNMFTVWS